MHRSPANPLQDDGEAADTPTKTNGHGRDGDEAADSTAPSDDAAATEPARDEPKPSHADDAAWEQMDDNFLLGDDQEEETTEKRTVGVTE